MDHTDREYHQQLDAMRENALKMAGLVESMIGSAVTALLTADERLAQEVILKDHEVDQLELEIDDLAVTILALWQPMASDLRLVILCFKMVTDLERIGDLAVNISERAQDFAGVTPNWSWTHVEEMGEVGRTMVRNAIDAFLARDAESAKAVIDQDDEMDDAYERAFNEILEGMIGHPEQLRLGVHALSVAKWLERIGDHATNLAEQVIFVLKGEDVRHATRTATLSK